MFFVSLPYITILWMTLFLHSLVKCGKSKAKTSKDKDKDQAPSTKNINPSMMTQIGPSQEDVKKEDALAAKSSTAPAAADGKSKKGPNEEKKTEESKKIQPYPSVKEPTASVKKVKAKELEKDKKEKIDKGFYQSKSDEDDTLEKVTSLKPEESDASKRNKSVKNKQQ